MIPQNEIITIEKLTKGKDSVGGYTETWAELVIVRASVDQRPGTMTFDGDTQMNSHSFLITFYTRYIDGLDYTCRIRYEDNVYDIKSIVPVMRRKGHQILCLRNENNGR